jgi:hypothetical protein
MDLVCEEMRYSEGGSKLIYSKFTAQWQKLSSQLLRCRQVAERGPPVAAVSRDVASIGFVAHGAVAHGLWLRSGLGVVPAE